MKPFLFLQKVWEPPQKNAPSLRFYGLLGFEKKATFKKKKRILPWDSSPLNQDLGQYVSLIFQLPIYLEPGGLVT